MTAIGAAAPAGFSSPVGSAAVGGMAVGGTPDGVASGESGFLFPGSTAAGSRFDSVTAPSRFIVTPGMRGTTRSIPVIT